LKLEIACVVLEVFLNSAMKKETPAVEEFQLFRKKMIDWYRSHHRKLPWRESRNPYHIWVSEAMLQQTRVGTAVPYYRRFLGQFPTLRALAEADLQTVLKAWEGLGYYARARNLHKAAQVVSNHHAGKIPQDYANFRKLPGVGEYIAAAVQSIAFDQPRAVVDGNVKRVLARLFLMEAPVNDGTAGKIFRENADKLLDHRHPGDFNQAMMELGAVICRPQNPLCAACPVSEFCRAFEMNKQDEFPRRKTREKTPEYRIAVGVVRRGEQILITRRAENGLLGGLWEFPGGKVHRGEETAAEACVREIKEEVNLEIKIDSHLTMIRHAYTHFKIVMDVFLCDYLSGEVVLKAPVDFKWITVEEIRQYPFPKANHKFISLLYNHNL
jgi:A/G-specific adenine glycosylase